MGISIKRALLTPLWVAQLATGAKSFVDNPLLGSPSLNRLGLHAARLRIAHRLAWRRRRRLARFVDAADRAAFDRDGYVERRNFLPRDQFERLREQVFTRPAPARETTQGNTVTRRIPLDPAYLRAVPALGALRAHPDWRGLTRYVASFDSEPLTYIQSIFTGRVIGDADPQTVLHADTFQPTMKAWLFLTDVDEDDGPFAYVPGSHRLSAQRLAWERTRSISATSADQLSARGSPRIDVAALDALGLPPPRRFAVPANTLIVADTFGFHQRVPARRASTRVEIWGYTRRNPFLPWAGLDIASLPGIAERRIAVMWALKDRFSRMLGQPWRDVGIRRPDE